ncbi:DNA polymerase eta subunit [Monoraphidium neglectum]|uniref:DNA polymerase eta subunit n=1 Tax=Monoraphidium neglectum TaxID=145388 RepID=A0A0D2LGZ9_9CHLO|nr:DNA polymerase eta subunit [Monoraphidium neglectum]KIZ05769.1 DNA polymerase eta subunit [Monoraphidium neglectum]|eukprot:XP_013904788.1 DNA polymerase eta subunit [Monoraphidium neglectum]
MADAAAGGGAVWRGAPRQHEGADGGAKAPIIGRVILHIDLDCFYAQVEQLRLDIPRDTPCAVQQWNGLIAVNYAARAAGITRHMRVPDAVKACPGLRLVHVQTIGGEGASDGAESAAAAAQRGSTKASIDEAYADISRVAAAELAKLQAGGQEGAAAAMRQAAECSCLEGGPLEPDAACDALLAAGALVAARVRAQVLERLGFTCSAGVAGNKLLAKIGSARNKPNKQTVGMPLSKIKGLGGKLGQRLTDGLGATAAGEVAAAPWQQLVGLLEDRASCKSFEPTSDKAKLAGWIKARC